MKVKKILLILLIVFTLTGCSNLKDLTIDDVMNTISIYNKKNPNTYRNGYKFYMPRNMKLIDAKDNYIILSDNISKYYVYVDFISFMDKASTSYKIKSDAYYSNNIKFNNIDGYVEINLQENNKYLIEIMYNYAKIEVMVDEDMINSTLVNTINILKSIEYNAITIKRLLDDDNLDYTEEVFDIFKDSNDNSNVLEHEEEDTSYEEEDIKDTDFLN